MALKGVPPLNGPNPGVPPLRLSARQKGSQQPAHRKRLAAVAGLSGILRPGPPSTSIISGSTATTGAACAAASAEAASAWGAACALVATLLRNFAAYSAALAGHTAAIIAADTLGATGGASTEVFMLAVWRASEICIGIVCAGVVLAGTDFGGAPRRLAALFASLGAEIMSQFVGALAHATPEPEFLDTQRVRRKFVRRIIALDPIVDQSLGESSRLRYHSPILQRERWTPCSAQWQAGAQRRLTWSSCRTTRPGKRRPSSWQLCRRSCDRRQNLAIPDLGSGQRRLAGWPTRPACSDSTRRRRGG